MRPCDESLPTSPTEDDDHQALLMIQREVGMALRLSFKAVTSEPLTERMAILLLRLALAESLRVSVAEATAGESESASSDA